MTDWKLINQGGLGIFWIMVCNDGENIDRTLREIWEEYFAEKWNGERLFNNGVLMMASYLLFVYPQQADFEKIDFTEIDISRFNIIEPKDVEIENGQLCRRLRNSITHARFIINEDDNSIRFRDQKPNGTDIIEFEIHTVDFGEFLNKFSNCVFDQTVRKDK